MAMNIANASLEALSTCFFPPPFFFANTRALSSDCSLFSEQALMNAAALALLASGINAPHCTRMSPSL
eukprot:5667921-Lingulodinium_polyedra.AAC.1